MVVAHAVRHWHVVTVAVGTLCPTHEHGHVMLLSKMHCGSAQNDNPGGGGGCVQSAGRKVVVTVGQDGPGVVVGTVVGADVGAVVLWHDSVVNA